MRQTIATLFLMMVVIAGCSPGTPAPEPNGVVLADLDLKGAPSLKLVRTPAPTGSGPAPDITDVAFLDEALGYAVTWSGIIEKTEDGGATWRQVYQLKGARFHRVEVAGLGAGAGSAGTGDGALFAAAQTGCEPGPNCEGPEVLVRSTDGGRTWTVIQPQLPALSSRADDSRPFAWLSFQFLTADVGYAVGDLTENALIRSMPLMVTRDGGRTWQQVPLPQGFSHSYGYFFSSPELGFVTAVNGTGEYHLLATDDGGGSWRSLYSTKAFGLFAVHFPSESVGYLGGGLSPKTEAQPRQVVLATRDGGATWSIASRVEDRGSPAIQLKMATPEQGWALRGGCWSMGANGPCGGALYHTRDGGKTWRYLGRGAGRIRAAGSRTWAVDGNGATTLWRTDDAATWQQLSRPDAVRVSQVRFLDSDTGFVGTNLGYFRTADGGKRWVRLPVTGPFDWGTWPFFLNRTTALRVAQGLLERSADGGGTWSPVTVPMPDLTERISAAALAAARPTHAWLSMERTRCMNPGCPPFLLYSDNLGAAWQPLEPGPPVQLRHIAFADHLHGVGLPWTQRLYLTADGGRTWVPQSGPRDVSLYHASYGGSSSRLWLAGTYADHGILLHSTDGGQHWQAWTSKEVWFEQIQFTSARDGWAVVRHSTGSGLLTTGDGGRTWTEVWPVGSR